MKERVKEFKAKLGKRKVQKVRCCSYQHEHKKHWMVQAILDEGEVTIKELDQKTAAALAGDLNNPSSSSSGRRRRRAAANEARVDVAAPEDKSDQ